MLDESNLYNLLEHENEHSAFLEELLKALIGDGWNSMTIYDAKKLNENNAKIKKALIDLVGAESKDELEQLELGIRLSPAPDSDKAVMINAIHALKGAV